MTAAPPAAQVVLEVLDLARAGRFAEIAARFAPNLRPLVVPETLAQAWEAELDRQGPVAAVGSPLSEPARPAGTVVRIPVACERGGFALVAAVGEEGLLLSLQLAPLAAAEPTAPWQPPAYARPDAFAEEEVALGSGPLAVGGTLSLPRAPGPRPAVVLLAGSGSLDRDETIGRNKPFKDLAWGLASRGIAVLRFDKITYAHAAELAGAADVTLDDEYLPHVLAAIRLLAGHPAVDAGRIHLLGHSLGGTVAPRVAAAAGPSVAGLILLAGGAQPLQRAILRQVRYLASLAPGGEAAAQPAIAALTRKVEQVESPDLSPATPADDLPLGAPAAYWLDLRGYDPAALAATLGKRMLVLQGGRDYQVTVDDDLAVWRAALGGRPDVTIRVHPALNHLFAPGEGPPSPAEYEPAQHVDPGVVAEIADWLAG